MTPTTPTLGLEEELQVVDCVDWNLASHDYIAGQQAHLARPGHIAVEIHRCAMEVQTPVCSGPHDLIASLAHLRGVARRRAEDQGQAVLAAGLHPFARWQEAQVYSDPDQYPHYARLVNEYRDIALGALSFGTHVHLGVEDPTQRMLVFHGVRLVLPTLLALSVSAPFFEGRDTGLMSWRHSLLGRYPRMGIPAVWPDHEGYRGHVERLRKLGCIGPNQTLWEDARLHPRYPTVEVRILDAMADLHRNWFVAALLQAEALAVLADASLGHLPAAWPSSLLEENKWRARRYGTGARLIDWDHDEELPFHRHMTRWLQRLESSARRLGTWETLVRVFDQLDGEGDSATQQRRQFEASGDLKGVVQALCQRTAVPWSADSQLRGVP